MSNRKCKQKRKRKNVYQIEEEIEKIPKEDTILILGDFNAQIGKEDYVTSVAGKFTIHERTNDNGRRLCDLAARTDMVISSTKFKHLKEHKITWTTTDKRCSTQIDHVLVNRRRQSSVKDISSYRGANADSDHFMVTAAIKQKIKKIITKKKIKLKWDINKLGDEKERKKYEITLEKLFQEREEDENVNTDWISIKKCIEKAATETIGREGKSNEKGWYDQKCREKLNEKVQARLKWLRSSKAEDLHEYKKIRNESNKYIRECKRKWVNNNIEEIERERISRNTKSFFKKVNEQNKKYKGKSTGIKNKDGRVIEEEKEYKRIWVDHFKELLENGMKIIGRKRKLQMRRTKRIKETNQQGRKLQG